MDNFHRDLKVICTVLRCSDSKSERRGGDVFCKGDILLVGHKYLLLAVLTLDRTSKPPVSMPPLTGDMYMNCGEKRYTHPYALRTFDSSSVSTVCTYPESKAGMFVTS